MALSGTAIPNKCEPGNDALEGVLRIPQSSIITGTPPTDYLVSYPGHLLAGS